MTTHRLFIISTIFSLLALGNNLNINAATLSRPAPEGEVTQSTGATNTGQTAKTVSTTVNRGALQLKAGEGAVVSNMRIRLRHGDGSSSTLYELEPAGQQDAGQDKAGQFERFRYSALTGAPDEAGDDRHEFGQVDGFRHVHLVARP